MPVPRPSANDDAEWLLCERHGGTRVLVAEDNHINQSLMQALLAQAGIEADMVDDGAQAVAAVAARAYPLILMDVQMPVLDGWEATRRIRAMPAGAHVPIIALTSSACMEDREASLAAGMSDHLAKPVDPALLYPTLGRWLDAAAAAAPAPLLTAETRTATLDVAAGLTFFGGQRAAYERGLRQFVAMYANGLPGDGKSPDRGLQDLHAMAGAAAVLGAMALAARAGKLQRTWAALAAEARAHALSEVRNAVLDVLDAATAYLEDKVYGQQQSR